MLYLYMEQSGDGCDYTIGCGQRLVALKSTDPAKASAEIVRTLEDYGIQDPSEEYAERTLDRALLLCDGDNGDGAKIGEECLARYLKQRRRAVAREREESARSEIERLQRKIDALKSGERT